jgi:hypothetical protein
MELTSNFIQVVNGIIAGERRAKGCRAIKQYEMK